MDLDSSSSSSSSNSSSDNDSGDKISANDTTSKSSAPSLPSRRGPSAVSTMQRQRPRLHVAVAAVKRVASQGEYTPEDYSVCLIREGQNGRWHFPTNIVKAGENPEELALATLKRQTGFDVSEAYSVSVQAKPNLKQHDILLFYVIPVPVEDDPLGPPSVETKFINLEDAVENRDNDYAMLYPHRDLLYAVDTWLNERHVIPFVNVDLLFLCSDEGEGRGGLVKAIVENPLSEANFHPIENQLLMGLNNPMFTAPKAVQERVSAAFPDN
ncbi:uncharacterized protein [Oscarella lobularis]|uniref:uncharacterized protein n=1 Tax=Oscarella lobularis TaxID=121494 RepID=UPI0033136470